MASSSIYFLLSIALIAIASSAAFTAMPTTASRSVVSSSSSSMLFMAEGEVKAAPQVSGEELEVMLQDWDTPLVVDAYATWYVYFGGEAATIRCLDAIQRNTVLILASTRAFS